MVTKIRWFAAMSAALFVAGARAEEKCGMCPVSGKEAKADCATDYKGGKVYFCCGNCCGKFVKDPAAFAAKAHHQMVGSGQMLQTGCPFSGNKLDPKTKTDVDGVAVCFCCEKCKAKFDAAEDKIACAFGNVEKGFTTQTKCPVGDKKINVNCFTKHEGKKVYFCCGKCCGEFVKDPAKYADKLPKG